MIVADVNVLLTAFRRDLPEHARIRAWLLDRLSEEHAFGVAELVLSAVVRIATNHRVFREPSSLDESLGFVNALRQRANVVVVSPGERHWDIFDRLCTAAGARGNLVADAYLAALAIEHGCDWVTMDRDFARLPGLRWRHPLD